MTLDTSLVADERGLQSRSELEMLQERQSGTLKDRARGQCEDVSCHCGGSTLRWFFGASG